MTLTINFTIEQEEALKEQVALEGKSLEEATFQALLEYMGKATDPVQGNAAQRQEASHRERVMAAANYVMERDAEILRRLAE